MPVPFDVEAHNALVDEMLAKGPDSEGRYTDPKTGQLFPKGAAMKKNPNRKERRDLRRFRSRKA